MACSRACRGQTERDHREHSLHTSEPALDEAPGSSLCSVHCRSIWTEGGCMQGWPASCRSVRAPPVAAAVAVNAWPPCNGRSLAYHKTDLLVCCAQLRRLLAVGGQQWQQPAAVAEYRCDAVQRCIPTAVLGPPPPSPIPDSPTSASRRVLEHLQLRSAAASAAETRPASWQPWCSLADGRCQQRPATSSAAAATSVAEDQPGKADPEQTNAASAGQPFGVPHSEQEPQPASSTGTSNPGAGEAFSDGRADQGSASSSAGAATGSSDAHQEQQQQQQGAGVFIHERHRPINQLGRS